MIRLKWWDINSQKWKTNHKQARSGLNIIKYGLMEMMKEQKGITSSPFLLSLFSICVVILTIVLKDILCMRFHFIKKDCRNCKFLTRRPN